MSRKDTLKAMLLHRSEKLPPGNSEPESIDAQENAEAHLSDPVPHVRAGVVGAMGRSLGKIASAAEAAKALVASGAVVVEISAEKLVSSFILDRLDVEGEEYQTLYAAIRDFGQKSPILVRPHPDHEDLYQIAYGHRRARILGALGRPVRAVVQSLTDDELVVIQGQENSARSDLSYIERGLFALTLEEHGFSRDLIMSALSVEKTQLSRLLSVTRSIPRHVIEAIGPAPKAGRPRWTALAERLATLKSSDKLNKLLTDPKFQTVDTDQRFVRLFNALAQKRMKSSSNKSVITSVNGRKIATVAQSDKAMSVTVDMQEAPEFGAFLAEQIPELYRQFQTQQEESA